MGQRTGLGYSPCLANLGPHLTPPLKDLVPNLIPLYRTLPARPHPSHHLPARAAFSHLTPPPHTSGSLWKMTTRPPLSPVASSSPVWLNSTVEMTSARGQTGGSR